MSQRDENMDSFMKYNGYNRNYITMLALDVYLQAA